MIQHVRKYALWGIPVFPVHWPQEGGARCSCKDGPECANIGKHPMTKNGVKDATTDLDQLEQVWARYPEANIGLATGVVMDVLDLDNDDEAIKALQNEIGLFAEDDPPIVQTGRGHHVWYRPIGSGNRAGIVPGVDWRGPGGYVLAPPSLHASGRRYEMHGGPFDLMPLPPKALCDLVLRQGRHAPSKVTPISGHRAYRMESSLVDQLDLPAYNASGLVSSTGDAPEGQRNSITYWALRSAMADHKKGRCSTSDMRQAISDICAAASDEAGLSRKEVAQILGSALRAEGLES